MKKLALTAVATLVTVPVLATTATPATARDMSFSRSSGTAVDISWTEWGALPGIDGSNVHTGNLYAEAGGGWAEGWVTDWFCEGDEQPGWGGGHGEYDEEPPCDIVSERYIWGEGVEVTVDRRLSTATITGTLEVSDHETGTGANPPVNITLTGTGDTSTTVSYERFTEGGWTYTYKKTSTSREALVDGYIGGMDFTDDDDDVSSASISSYRYSDRSRTR